MNFYQVEEYFDRRRNWRIGNRCFQGTPGLQDHRIWQNSWIVLSRSFTSFQVREIWSYRFLGLSLASFAAEEIAQFSLRLLWSSLQSSSFLLSRRCQAQSDIWDLSGKIRHPNCKICHPSSNSFMRCSSSTNLSTLSSHDPPQNSVIRCNWRYHWLRSWKARWRPSIWVHTQNFFFEISLVSMLNWIELNFWSLLWF